MKMAIFCFALLNMALIGYTQQLVVAVDNFIARSGFSKDELADITDLFASFLLETRKVRVLTRNNSQWESIFKEHGFARDSGLVEPSEIRELGRALGANAIVTGTMGSLGSGNILYMFIHDVVSGEMLSTARKTFKDLNEFNDVVLPDLASDIVKLLVTSPLIGRWKIDNSSTILTFNDDGTFEIQNCSYYDSFKKNDIIENKSPKTTSFTSEFWDVTIPRMSYSRFDGEIRGNYSYTDKEIILSGKFYGIRYDYFFIYSYYEYTLGELDYGNFIKKGIIESNGSTNVRDIESKASISYNLSNSNSLRLSDCKFFIYRLVFTDNRDDRKLIYSYYNNFSRVN
jgi:hypothetical protein